MTDPTPESGRELDAVVAEEVMEWEPTQPNWKGTWFKRPDGELVCTHSDLNGTALGNLVQWNPSIDIAAAWDVIEGLEARGFYVSLNTSKTMSDEFVGWAVEADGHGVIAKTAPLAICRCALKAVRADTEGADAE